MCIRLLHYHVNSTWDYGEYAIAYFNYIYIFLKGLDVIARNHFLEQINFKWMSLFHPLNHVITFSAQMQQTRPQTHRNIMREQNCPFQEVSWKEQDIPQCTSAALRAGGETCASWYRLWALPLTIVFDLAWGDRRKCLSGQVQADL